MIQPYYTDSIVAFGMRDHRAWCDLTNVVFAMCYMKLQNRSVFNLVSHHMDRFRYEAKRVQYHLFFFTCFGKRASFALCDKACDARSIKHVISSGSLYRKMEVY